MADYTVTEAGDATPSPSKAIVAGANKTVSRQDSAGRTIVVRMLGPLDRMRLFRIVGAECSSNQAYLNYASMAASVVSIDGERLGMPASIREIEALVERLGDDGFEAIGLAFGDLSPAARAALEKAGLREAGDAAPDGDPKDDAKN